MAPKDGGAPRFELCVELGGEAMRGAGDVAWALERVAGVLSHDAWKFDATESVEGVVRDELGNTVGMWRLVPLG